MKVMSAAWRTIFEIDGQQVRGEAIYNDDGPMSILTGVKLEGPVKYNGHIHGTKDELHLCLPNVVDSVAITGDACDQVPMEGSFIFAVWY